MVWPTLGSRTAKSLEQNSHKIFVVGTFSAPSRAIPGFDSAHWPPTSFATETVQCRRPYACCVCDAAAACVRVFAPQQPDNRRLRLAGRSISCRRNRANFVGLLRCGRSAESSTFDVVYVSFVDVADAQAAAVARQSTYARLVSVSSRNPHDVTPARPGARL